MDFIQDGVSLTSLFVKPEAGARILSDDIGDEEMETIYRQLAVFLLQLFKLEFARIESLDSPSAELSLPVRPLTWKVHEILQQGGVDTFGDRERGFSSTSDYFTYVVEQDWQQLVHQPNSTFGKCHAMDMYEASHALKSIMPDFVHKDYDSSGFKLICDDLGLGNLMVRSREDLTVVGLVDLEWSYIGPAQLFASAPWWLLGDRPTNPDWDYKEGVEPKELSVRYFRYLDIFQRVLEQEEKKMRGHEDKELSRLVQLSRDSGAMWLHMLLSSGFNAPRTFPFAKLIEHVGADEWERRKDDANQEEVTAFGVEKLRQQDEYTVEVDKMEADKRLVDEGGMTQEAFVSKHSQLDSSLREGSKGQHTS